MRPLMSLYRTIFALALIGLLPHEATAQGDPMDPMPDPPPGQTPPSTAAGACTIVGQLLGPTDFGVAAGLPLADMSAVLLADGRVRMYMFAQDLGIVSALSVSTDGASFIPEAGTRLPDGSGMPRAVAAPEGGLRMFFISGDGIKSAVSADGLTFTIEEGFRITAEAAGFGSPTALRPTSGASVVQLADGTYRMYFSDLPRPGDPPGDHWIKSAVSTDQLIWTVEDGVRIGPGAPVLTEPAEHPFALANPDGTVTLYYGKFAESGLSSPEGVYESTSADGLTFETETYDVFHGNDPDVLRLSDGSLVVYYGDFVQGVGGTINLARCADPGGVGESLSAGQLLPGGTLSSANRQYRLAYQSDGNLVLFNVLAGTAVWASDTGGTSPGSATMQSDGNFVIYNGTGTPVWSSGTGGNLGATLAVQNDGNVVISNAAGQAIWSHAAGILRR